VTAGGGRDRRSGFSLAELLVVIAITGIVIGVGVPMVLSASDSPVFDYLGRALPSMTYTVTNSTTGSSLTVSVATSGRVAIP
jgi:prepilin-type N-terminal cleavage/methylation domain-containing protein